jgi:hypothetical protein
LDGSGKRPAWAAHEETEEEKWQGEKGGAQAMRIKATFFASTIPTQQVSIFFKAGSLYTESEFC